MLIFGHPHGFILEHHRLQEGSFRLMRAHHSDFYDIFAKIEPNKKSTIRPHAAVVNEDNDANNRHELCVKYADKIIIFPVLPKNALLPVGC